MSPLQGFLIGFGTLPAIAVLGYLSVFLVSRVITLLGRLSLGTLHKIDPDSDRTVPQRRAAVVFGLRRGVVFSLGEFVLIIGTDLDEKARKWADSQLRPKLDLNDNFKKRMRESNES